MVIGDGVRDRAEAETAAAAELAFEAFFATAEPKLRRALVARHGVDHGREATLDALTYGWRNWERVRAMANPLGYLYRVGANHVRRAPITIRLDGELAGALEPEPWAETWVEPKLEAGLDRLSEPQRVAVVLRHGFEWTYAEIAELLDVSVSTVRNHLDRAMSKLRDVLEVDDDGR